MSKIISEAGVRVIVDIINTMNEIKKIDSKQAASSRRKRPCNGRIINGQWAIVNKGKRAHIMYRGRLIDGHRPRYYGDLAGYGRKTLIGLRNAITMFINEME